MTGSRPEAPRSAPKNTETPPSDLLTAEQIAAEYGIGYKRIRALAQAGIIPKVPHMGRRILIHRDNVEAFVRGEA